MQIISLLPFPSKTKTPNPNVWQSQMFTASIGFATLYLPLQTFTYFGAF